VNYHQSQPGKENRVKVQPVTNPSVALWRCFQTVPRNRDPQLSRR